MLPMKRNLPFVHLNLWNANNTKIYRCLILNISINMRDKHNWQGTRGWDYTTMFEGVSSWTPSKFLFKETDKRDNVAVAFFAKTREYIPAASSNKIQLHRKNKYGKE